MRVFLLLACLALFVGSTSAQDGVTYMRDRGPVGQGFHGSVGFYPPFYGNFYPQPFVVGSYYQRPYPTHLDYFRLRGTPMPECPCLDMMAVPPTPEVLPAQ